ncbi:MAG: hypothetical protein KGI54_09570 [Pseudomonadota bacterium]|nr:hypothetical protein [Pseudomonadota bacterium]
MRATEIGLVKLMNESDMPGPEGAEVLLNVFFSLCVTSNITPSMFEKEITTNMNIDYCEFYERTKTQWQNIQKDDQP